MTADEARERVRRAKTLAERGEIVSRRTAEIWDHEDAGCFGDADIARKWMRRELDEVEVDDG